MNSSAAAHALHSQFSDVEEHEAPKPSLVTVEEPPRPLEDPLFRYVFLGFVSLLMILGIAAVLSF